MDKFLFAATLKYIARIVNLEKGVEVTLEENDNVQGEEDNVQGKEDNV